MSRRKLFTFLAFKLATKSLRFKPSSFNGEMFVKYAAEFGVVDALHLPLLLFIVTHEVEELKRKNSCFTVSTQ